ncbi:RrF2 family transcriptional regulator [Pontiella agarivorans]|uniref:Rrf2 family transcriptional regulator n=1 Tax=Pontiella agarivorans TaxID=3038953 RepID=A0ABU5MVI7_9BACT|nr:Rrf2 family transcriptional regulator [Pontiella agarivorans]MDZ8118251.1 Rrf2 family transcriptional regulator [Pontiella agarivorans]
MQLKQNTDYALRILMYVARSKEPQVSSREISEAYDISYSHTVKIVNKLGKLGYLTLRRGRYGGGISMGAEPASINLATVVRQFETNFDMVECFNADTNTCVLDGRCKLKKALQVATEAFLDSLKETTLADLIGRK